MAKTPTANIIRPGTDGYVEYEIDIERVLRTDLPTVLQDVPIAPLTADAIMTIPQGAKGAYVLFEDGHPVYAGKTDTRHGFRNRLTRHAGTIRHRHNIDPAKIGFKAVRILVFSNFDVEAILIDALRKADPTALAWNTSGFGSNDPGHRRETQEPADFDKQRPIDIDRPLGIASGQYDLLPLFISMKEGLPYYFRYQTDHLAGKEKPERYTVGHADFRSAPSISVRDTDTFRVVLERCLQVLPHGWLATVFPDRVILYDDPTRYAYGMEVLHR